jgi:hypothetical protein
MRQLKEITTVLESQNYSLNVSICDVMKKFKFKTLVHQAGLSKASGFSVTSILTLLIILPLMLLENVNQFYKSAYAKEESMQKDTIYRLKNNEHYPWRSLLYKVAKAYKDLVEPKNGEEEKKITALIIDDTTDQRVGYKIENISHIFDHVLHKTVYGFKILALTYFNGTTSQPLDFSIHTEKKLAKKKHQKQYKKESCPKSSGSKRRKEAKTTKGAQAIAMIKRAVKHGFSADYVLCDSWFTSEALIAAVRDTAKGSMHLIAGVPNGNRKYGYADGLFNAKEIIALLKKEGNERRCRKWGTRYFEVVAQYKGVGTVKMFMSRYPGQKKWRVFITTDLSLSYVKMIEIYSIRWTIEVMFRECKQHLLLGKCQSRDFDAQIASVTITFMLYTFLVFMKQNQDYSSVGEALLFVQQDVCEKNLAERLFELFESLLELAITTITENGVMDISYFKTSAEYKYIMEIFASSFLFDQMISIDKSA